MKHVIFLLNYNDACGFSLSCITGSCFTSRWNLVAYGTMLLRNSDLIYFDETRWGKIGRTPSPSLESVSVSSGAWRHPSVPGEENSEGGKKERHKAWTGSCC